MIFFLSSDRVGQTVTNFDNRGSSQTLWAYLCPTFVKLLELQWASLGSNPVLRILLFLKRLNAPIFFDVERQFVTAQA